MYAATIGCSVRLKLGFLRGLNSQIRNLWGWQTELNCLGTPPTFPRIEPTRDAAGPYNNCKCKDASSGKYTESQRVTQLRWMGLEAAEFTAIFRQPTCSGPNLILLWGEDVSNHPLHPCLQAEDRT